uniref:EMI domain-containing protein n=1 Tax=Biomphalaria glabrata TaxID=6526 RepID=A0A2C9LH55_BIOGL
MFRVRKMSARLVECPVEHNRTIAEYIVVEECCPGFVLDPINNVTCIRENIGGLHYDLEDNTIFGLSHGAYAGIVCTLLFFMCVIILTAWHIFKRKRNARLKDFKMEMCVTEKMMPPKTSKL